MTERINTPQELKALRDRARAETDLRGGPCRIRVTVHMGTCGIAAGARDVLLAVMESLGDQAGGISIHQSGCIGLCQQEPMISIEQPGGEVARYGKLDRLKVQRIVNEHVMHGRAVQEFLI